MSKHMRTQAEVIEYLRWSRLHQIAVDGDSLKVTHWNGVVEEIVMPTGAAIDLLIRLKEVWAWMPQPLARPERQPMSA